MKKHIITSIFLALCCMANLPVANAQNIPVIPRDPEIEKQIDKILSKMTLTEKVGQMTQLDINLLLPNMQAQMMKLISLSQEDLEALIKEHGLENDYDAADLANKDKLRQNGFKFYQLQQQIQMKKGVEFDPAIMDSVFVKYKVGSILNTPYTTAQNVKQWNHIMKTIQEKSLEAIGIPCLYGIDQIHGSTYIADGTLFPQGVNMAATFNRDLARRTGEVTAYETRAGGIPWSFNPVLDMGRQPAWPRQWEGYGEDPHLASEIGREVILGMQGDDPNHIGRENISACLKHYMGYGVPFNGLDRTPAIINDQDMREKQFAPFLEALRSGALSIMTNSSTINGVNGVANPILLTQWVKEDLGWDGMIVTDWADITSLHERDRIASSYKEAVKMAINAGIDMAMVPSSWQFCIDLKELVEEGQVPVSRIDDAVRRILRLKFRLGLFDTPYTVIEDYPRFGDPAFATLSLEAAQESMVLLKNEEGILPLPKGKKILVAGPNANTMRGLNGGWSYTWQGSGIDRFTEQFNTILEAMQNEFGSGNIIYEPGVLYNEQGFWTMEHEPEIEKSVAAAAGADYIMVCIGENSYCETTGNINDLHISQNQANLVKALAATGKPVILILNQGRPRVIAQLVPLAKGIVNVMLPGNYGGDALANLLAGKENFSGRMSYTYPSGPNGYTTYDYKVCEARSPIDGPYDYFANTHIQWPFGYGLSYTTFAYANLKADKTSFTATDELTFTIDVKNTGEVAGKESVLLYSSDLYASLMPDNRRLRAFDKISLEPGETRTVTLTIPAQDLAFVGQDGKWVLEAGDFKIGIGDQSLMIRCTKTHKWEQPNRP
ncbi:MAG: glycoside hydrolase family 3 N-terminal domain-containing protein [Bacteroidales bacterium]|jgi:beta-glucosidase